MDTSRSSSVHSMRPEGDELLDHRNQPHSLPRNISQFEDPFGEMPDVMRRDFAIPSERSKVTEPQASVSRDKNTEETRNHLKSSTRGFGSTARRNTDATLESTTSVPEDVEEDVCFPLTEDAKVSHEGIDFDEMDEFVREQREDDRETNSEKQKSRKYSVASTFRGKLFEPRTNAVTFQTTESAIDDDEDEITSDESIAKEKPSISVPVEPYHKPLGLALEYHRYSFLSSEMVGTIHADQFGDLLVEGQSFRDLFKPETTWWLDCSDPSDGEMRMLAKAFAIHPLTAEDIRVQETREKVELFRSYYFVCFRSFQLDANHSDFMEPINIYIIVFRNGILTFQFSRSPHSNNVRRRIRQLREYVTLTPDWICYAMIDDITDSFGPAIERVEKETDAIEDLVFVARADDFQNLLRSIGKLRKSVMGLMRLLGGKADVIKMFAKRCNEQWDVAPKGEIGLYLGDIQDHIVTMYQNLGHYEKILSRSHANYLAQLSVDNIAANNRVNQVLGKITLIGTILVPLNFVTGLWGMNVPVPGRETESLAWWFGILGCIGVVVILAFTIARRWLWSMGL